MEWVPGSSRRPGVELGSSNETRKNTAKLGWVAGEVDREDFFEVQASEKVEEEVREKGKVRQMQLKSVR